MHRVIEELSFDEGNQSHSFDGNILGDNWKSIHDEMVKRLQISETDKNERKQEQSSKGRIIKSLSQKSSPKKKFIITRKRTQSTGKKLAFMEFENHWGKRDIIQRISKKKIEVEELKKQVFDCLSFPLKSQIPSIDNKKIAQKFLNRSRAKKEQKSKDSKDSKENSGKNSPIFYQAKQNSPFARQESKNEFIRKTKAVLRLPNLNKLKIERVRKPNYCFKKEDLKSFLIVNHFKKKQTVIPIDMVVEAPDFQTMENSQ